MLPFREPWFWSVWRECLEIILSTRKTTHRCASLTCINCISYTTTALPFREPWFCLVWRKCQEIIILTRKPTHWCASFTCIACINCISYTTTVLPFREPWFCSVWWGCLEIIRKRGENLKKKDEVMSQRWYHCLLAVWQFWALIPAMTAVAEICGVTFQWAVL